MILPAKARVATFAVVSLKLFLQRVKARKPDWVTKFDGDFDKGGSGANFNRLKSLVFPWLLAEGRISRLVRENPLAGASGPDASGPC